VFADGTVALVQDEPFFEAAYNTAFKAGLPDNRVFKVRWIEPGASEAGSMFPTANATNNTCNSPGCAFVDVREGSCLCAMDVQTRPLRNDLSVPPPTETELRANLHIGAAAPRDFGTYDDGTPVYVLCSTPACTATPGVSVYTRRDSSAGVSGNGTLDTDTIYEFTTSTRQPQYDQIRLVFPDLCLINYCLHWLCYLPIPCAFAKPTTTVLLGPHAHWLKISLLVPSTDT